MIGTLTQQAIQTVPCQKSSSNGIALLPIAQASLKCVEATSDRVHFLTRDLKASLIAGLSGVQQPNSFSPTCPSGNCAFQASDGSSYSTLGLRSECIDVSKLITQSRREMDAWVSGKDSSWDGDPEEQPITNYTLPNGLTLTYDLSPGLRTGQGGRWNTALSQAQLGWPDEIGLSPENVTMTDRQRHIVMDTRFFDAILLFMPTINPCQKPSDYYSYFDDSEVSAMPAINVNSCPEFDLPGVDTLRLLLGDGSCLFLFYLLAAIRELGNKWNSPGKGSTGHKSYEHLTYGLSGRPSSVVLAVCVCGPLCGRPCSPHQH